MKIFTTILAFFLIILMAISIMGTYVKLMEEAEKKKKYVSPLTRTVIFIVISIAYFLMYTVALAALAGTMKVWAWILEFV